MKFTANSGGPALEGPIRFGSWRFALGLLLLLCAGGLTGTWAQPLRQPTAHGDSHTTAHVACCSYVQGSKIIDPNWYVDRGVRPIGRYGKRLLTGSRSPSPPSGPLSPVLAARAPILRVVTSSGLRGRAGVNQQGRAASHHIAYKIVFKKM
ncbi:unnamed protein product [Lampetra fluviatilis]